MKFNEHLEVADKHSFLSPSKYHWTNYSDEKLIATYTTFQAAKKGTELHDFAKRCIELGILLPRNHKTLNMYVNDAIKFNMKPETVLYFSRNCFGTADTIVYDRNVLRIHDLKTGVSPASMRQLEVYTAIFCLEYDCSPLDFRIELRIYQNDEVLIGEPFPEIIFNIMDKIITFDQRIEELKMEGI